MRIPIGNFGNNIVQPVQSARVVTGAFDEGGSGMQKAGDALLHAGNELLTEQKNQDLALTRVKAVNAVQDHEIAIKKINLDIEQQISDGAVNYTDAQTVYKQRLSDLGTPDTTGMDPVTMENFSKGVKRAEFMGETSIGHIVAKAKHDDFRTQTDAIMDRFGKQFGLPNADPAKIIAQIDATDETGKLAYGAAWGKKKQDLIDSGWDAHLNQQAMTVRDDMAGIKTLEKQITEGDYADKLDSNKRNTLIGKLEGYRTSLIQRNEAAAARAQRDQERYLKQAEAEYNTFVGMTDKGTILAPEYIDRAMKMTAGTPYQQGIKAMAKQAQETGGIAAQPIAAQQVEIDRLDAVISTQGRSPALDKRREQLVKVRDGSLKDIHDDGVRAWTARSNDVMKPIDVSTPEAFAGSIAERLSLAERASQWAGQAVSPLDSHEAETVRTMLAALPAKQKSQAVATISAAVGPRLAGAMALQIEKQDKPLALAFATASSKTTEGRYTSELILKGSQAIKDGVVMKDDKKVTGWKATIAQQIEGAFPDERLAGAAKESAYYIAAGIAQENGGSVSTNELKRAVKLAIGGDVIERNGKKLPIPAGMDAGDFETRLRNVSASDILKQSPDGKVRVGGAEMSTESFAATVPGQELMYAGPGKYAVIVKGRPVMNSAGRPIIIGVQ